MGWWWLRDGVRETAVLGPVLCPIGSFGLWCWLQQRLLVLPFLPSSLGPCLYLCRSLGLPSLPVSLCTSLPAFPQTSVCLSVSIPPSVSVHSCWRRTEQAALRIAAHSQHSQLRPHHKRE